ncbi:ATP-binding protein [bacterium]|nr:ATP-binding protein [bacterium]
MDPRHNPYAPGAGSPPPELAGRGPILEAASIALDRLQNGLHARSVMLVGLRGVGKTVLLNRMHTEAQAKGYATAVLESPEDRSLPALLVPTLRVALLKLDRMHAASSMVKRAVRALGGFIAGMKVKFDDIEVGFDLGKEPGLADSGDLEADLISLFEAVGEAAQEQRTVMALFIDELQYVSEDQLASLITAIHRCSQRSLPITLIGAGLPQLVGQMGKAKSYAERLFEFQHIGPLGEADARVALTAPAARAGVAYAPDALDEILRQTEGYAYFLQEWGKHTWNIAQATPIQYGDVEQATAAALADLDGSFFRVRLAPAEKRYLRAMAELGPGPHRSGDVANRLNRGVQSVAPTRASLIRKGMVYSPAHGDTAFTVPLFDAFMRRMMPSFE